MLLRVIRCMQPVTSNITVVRAPDQALPPLPAGVNIIQDDIADLGPLQGIATGLRPSEGNHELAFVSATDTPLLQPKFIKRLVELVTDEYDIVVPHTAGYDHPLAALYRPSVHHHAQALLDAGQRRPVALFERVRTRRVDASTLLADEELRAADPDLSSLRNVNTPEELEQAMLTATDRMAR